jgi:site-specific DNA-cytosine methylase
MSKKILIGCEESQAVCIAFRELGFEAYSCDLIPCSGGHPEWHLQDNIFHVICASYALKWDLLIGHPPCTFLSNAGNDYFNVKKYGSKALERWNNRIDAAKFFIGMLNANIEYVAIENPIGWMNSIGFKPDQIIEPWYFGDEHKKRTDLWLKNLPKLTYQIGDNIFYKNTSSKEPEPIYMDKSGKKRYFTDAIGGKNAQLLRSKTFPGIARAMAEQWGKLL